MAKKRAASRRTAARAVPKRAAPGGAKRAAVVSPQVMDYLAAIQQSRSTIRDIRERIYQRAVALAGQAAGSQEDVDKAALDLEAAKIDLANAAIDLVKAQAGDGPQ
jgi:multidrug resistance efflux pump